MQYETSFTEALSATLRHEHGVEIPASQLEYMSDEDVHDLMDTHGISIVTVALRVNGGPVEVVYF